MVAESKVDLRGAVELREAVQLRGAVELREAVELQGAVERRYGCGELRGWLGCMREAVDLRRCHRCI